MHSWLLFSVRKRCKARIKARRGALFDHLRSLGSEDNVRNVLCNFIESDLKELQASKTICSVKDDSMAMTDCAELPDEPMSDDEQWILEEYERLLESNEALLELAEQIVCPLCELGVLSSVCNFIACSICSLVLPHRLPLPHLESLIISAIDDHNQHCKEKSQFAIFPDNNSTNLFLVCPFCNYLREVI